MIALYSMSFLPLGAGVEMRSPAKKFMLNAAQQRAVEARNLARRRTEIEAGTNVEQRVFDNPDLRGILLGRQEFERTLPPVVRGGKEYTDPKDPGQAGLYKGGLFGQVRDIETYEKDKGYRIGIEDARDYFKSADRADLTTREVLDSFIDDERLVDTIENSYRHSRPEDFYKNIEAAHKFQELTFDPEAKDGDEILIDDLDDLIGEHNAVDDIDVNDDVEDVGDNKYRYTTTRDTLHKISDRSKYDVVKRTTYGPFEHEYLENGEQDYEAEGDDEDYYPESKYFLKLKKVLPKIPTTRYYGRPK